MYGHYEAPYNLMSMVERTMICSGLCILPWSALFQDACLGLRLYLIRNERVLDVYGCKSIY